MSIILTKNDVFNLTTKSQVIPFFKDQLTNSSQKIGKIIDLWSANGNPSASTLSFTANGTLLSKSTSGALQFRNAGLNKDLYLSQIKLNCAWGNITDNFDRNLLNINTGVIHVWDKVWQNGGLTTNTNNSITQSNLTRYASGEGLSLWFRMYTVTNQVGTLRDITFTITYINSNDQTNVVSFMCPADNGLGGIHDVFCMPLLSDDIGIKKITNINSSTNTTSPSATAGTYGLFLAKYYGAFPFVDQTAINYQNNSTILNNRGIIHNDACLSFGVQFAGSAYAAASAEQYTKSTTSMPKLMGEITLIEA